jgi:predicted esterase
MALSSPETAGPNSPMANLEKLSKIPICVQHGMEDNVISIQESEEFVSKAKKNGLTVKFLKTKTGHIAISRDERRYAFSFLDSLKRGR